MTCNYFFLTQRVHFNLFYCFISLNPLHLMAPSPFKKFFFYMCAIGYSRPFQRRCNHLTPFLLSDIMVRIINIAPSLFSITHSKGNRFWHSILSYWHDVLYMHPYVREQTTHLGGLWKGLRSEVKYPYHELPDLKVELEHFNPASPHPQKTVPSILFIKNKILLDTFFIQSFSWSSEVKAASLCTVLESLAYVRKPPLEGGGHVK